MANRPRRGGRMKARRKLWLTGCLLPQMSTPCQSSQYNGSPDVIFDDAVLLLCIQHSRIGTGYAGACRPDRQAFPRSRCRVNLGKWRRHIGEWSEIFRMMLLQFLICPLLPPMPPGRGGATPLQKPPPPGPLPPLQARRGRPPAARAQMRLVLPARCCRRCIRRRRSRLAILRRRMDPGQPEFGRRLRFAGALGAGRRRRSRRRCRQGCSSAA
jgi:hypothetical protein